MGEFSTEVEKAERAKKGAFGHIGGKTRYEVKRARKGGLVPHSEKLERKNFVRGDIGENVNFGEIGVYLAWRWKKLQRG